MHESDRTLWRYRDFIRTRMSVKYKLAKARGACTDAAGLSMLAAANLPHLVNRSSLDVCGGRAARRHT
ncbi:hypothetical protein ABZ746_34205 [Streptomyces sp. NPDC020096]